jgi:hypothetical protein
MAYSMCEISFLGCDEQLFFESPDDYVDVSYVELTTLMKAGSMCVPIIRATQTSCWSHANAYIHINVLSDALAK